MTNRVAFNPQDRFLLTINNTLIVTTQNGDVFGLDASGHPIGEAFKFSGSRVAFNPQDRFVVTMGNRLIVITQDGDVFGHDVSGRDISTPFQFSGSKVAFNHEHDRFVVTMGNRLIVTTQNGDAFEHDVSGQDIGSPSLLNPDDVQVFDTGPLTSGLPLGGSMHLVMRRSGDFTFSCHAHDSGFDNIDYVVSGVLMTPSGIAFTFQHSGHVEGTTAGLPFGTPNREDNFITGGTNPAITNEWGGMPGAKLAASIDGKDTLVGGLEGILVDLLKKAADELEKAAAAAVVALVF